MIDRKVAAIWSMAKIDFTYECSNCGAEIRQTVTKPELLNYLYPSANQQQVNREWRAAHSC